MKNLNPSLVIFMNFDSLKSFAIMRSWVLMGHD